MHISQKGKLEHKHRVVYTGNMDSETQASSQEDFSLAGSHLDTRKEQVKPFEMLWRGMW